MKRMICWMQALCMLPTAAALADQEAQERLEKEIGFLNDLAGRKGVVLMYGPGSSAPEGTVRISMANLYAEDYVESGMALANAA